jgi:hypothetical protein
MIKANELRLGNYVLCKGKVERIHGVNYHGDIKLNLYADKYTDEDINAIPLTLEWLERMGFKKESSFLNVQHYSISIIELPKLYLIQLEEKEGIYQLIINDGETDLGKPFQYVHQLQNLYFALVGEELTINETT